MSKWIESCAALLPEGMTGNLWWLWVVIGILLIGMEIIVPSFIIMWFGVAAIIAALPVYLGASTSTVLFTYALSLLLLTTFVRKISLGLFSRGCEDVPTNTDRIIGRVGVVIEPVDSVAGTGRVRVEKEVWSARSIDDKKIDAEERIVVKAVNGVKLIIAREEEK